MKTIRLYTLLAALLVALAGWQYGLKSRTDAHLAQTEEVSDKPQQSTAPAPQQEEESLEERLRLAKQFASRLSNFRFQKLAKVKATRLGGSEWFINEDIIASSLQKQQQQQNLNTNINGCLVYSFGVGEDDDYTQLMASRGCHVYAFDPTVRHPTQWMDRVTFYPWGLRNSESTKEWSHPIYGNITGSFYTLPQIIQRLGHDDQRTITAIKFDCEGCEFGAFKDLVVGQVQNPIVILNTEFHFATTLGMVNIQDVERIYYAHVYLSSHKCKLLHYKRNPGFETDEYKVPEILTQAGVNSRFCCYELNYICGNISGYVALGSST